MDTEDKAFRVWVGIIELTNEIWKYVAITKAYEHISSEKCHNPKKGDFFDVAFQAIWDQLLLDISKMFDRARTCGNENCSINLLKELVQKSPDFSNTEKSWIVRNADYLCEIYNTIITRELRNKQIAHYDLEILVNNTKKKIQSEQLKLFVVDVAKFLSIISTRFLNERGSIYFRSLEETIEEYETTIRKCYLREE